MSKKTTSYKDIEKFCEKRKEYNKKYYAKTALYEPRLWTKKENELVLAHNITDDELSKKIKRSVQSIQTQRSRLKKRMNDNS